MIQPFELKLNLPVRLTHGAVSTTAKVWEVLLASKNGDLSQVKRLVQDCPELIYAQYNYTPPVYFAAREGHTILLEYLLMHEAHDPDYKTYPFHENLQTIAADRNHKDI